MEKILDIVREYAPYIFFDDKEPFFPRMVGYTIFEETQRSSSFNRIIEIGKYGVRYAIEYAIYWDYDITHLYDLEHFWVFVGENGEVVDAQGSFHGKYLTMLMKDRSNIIDDTHVKIYSQPGKHAFAPIPTLFDYVPGVETSTYEDVGIDGLVVTEIIAKGRYDTTPEINEAVQKYMQKYKFRPSHNYSRLYDITAKELVEWKVLDDSIPGFLVEELQKILQS